VNYDVDMIHPSRYNVSHNMIKQSCCCYTRHGKNIPCHYIPCNTSTTRNQRNVRGEKSVDSGMWLRYNVSHNTKTPTRISKMIRHEQQLVLNKKYDKVLDKIQSIYQAHDCVPCGGWQIHDFTEYFSPATTSKLFLRFIAEYWKKDEIPFRDYSQESRSLAREIEGHHVTDYVSILHDSPILLCEEGYINVLSSHRTPVGFDCNVVFHALVDEFQLKVDRIQFSEIVLEITNPNYVV